MAFVGMESFDSVLRTFKAARSDLGEILSSCEFIDSGSMECVTGNLRVDYVLPSADWRVTGAGVHWPDGEAGEIAGTASRHRLVWVDLAD